MRRLLSRIGSFDVHICRLNQRYLTDNGVIWNQVWNKKCLLAFDEANVDLKLWIRLLATENHIAITAELLICFYYSSQIWTFERNPIHCLTQMYSLWLDFELSTIDTFVDTNSFHRYVINREFDYKNSWNSVFFLA